MKFNIDTLFLQPQGSSGGSKFTIKLNESKKIAFGIPENNNTLALNAISELDLNNEVISSLGNYKKNQTVSTAFSLKDLNINRYWGFYLKNGKTFHGVAIMSDANARYNIGVGVPEENAQDIVYTQFIRPLHFKMVGIHGSAGAIIDNLGYIFEKE